MQKKYNIRWRESDHKELERTIKNFNAQIRYHKKKNPKIAKFYPETVKKADALRQIKTRADYNKYIKTLQRFSKKEEKQLIKNAKGHNITTKWEWKEYKKREKAQNEWKAQERERISKLPQKSRGKELGYTVRMDTEKMNSLNPVERKTKGISSHYEFERFTRTVDNRVNPDKLAKHYKTVKENYITSMHSVGIDDDIIEYVETLDGHTISDMMMVDTDATISFVYGQEQLDLKNRSLRNVWGINKEE